ncbi:putative beta-D-xylosidase 6 [Ananas comosus]|uniref:Putative beta-D-xylosidase 6 n=1 Tax=Ananas comosus TaxID=4615 RepID=A0A199VJI1_ANACO|nr:putative beta-D-xylosidase 6 [Ananas comosus]
MISPPLPPHPRRRRHLLRLLLLLVVSAAGAGAAAALPPRPCAPANGASAFPFCNATLPAAARARSLVSLLSLDEKIQQLSDAAAAVPRLGLPAYEWWSESLHGVAANGPGVRFAPPVPAATSFPNVVLSAAALNRSLWRSLARAVAVEARSMYNVGLAGLTFWAPNINIFRDPRWGRGQETPGEDPLVTSAYAVEYVKGFQGEYDEYNDGGSSMILSACCKHYTAYDLEKWGNFTRYTFNAKVTEQDLEDTFQPPFRSCIEEGHASCLMCAYNQVNGVPMCARKDLLEKARQEWGFKGSLNKLLQQEKLREVSTARLAGHFGEILTKRMDINCGSYLLRHMKSAVQKGKVQEEDIDRALLNLFSVQLRLGLFDGNEGNQWFTQLGPNNVCTKEHRELALEAARQGIVLLKNDKEFLPLKKNEIGHLALIGPAINDTSILGGDYTGVPCNPISFLNGIQAYVPKLSFAVGCVDVPCNSTDKFEEAITIAREADIVIVVAGLNQTEETEDHDRVSLLLPGKQMDLINGIVDASKKPLVLVLMGGGPTDVSFAKENPAIASILWIGYPGEAGGRALADVIFGEFNPGGRLPVTWYPESFTNIPMNDMNMRADPSRGYPGRTYRFYTGEVVFSFGYGLSYSNYSYRSLSAPERVSLSELFSEADIGRKLAYAERDGCGHVKIEEISSCDALRFSVHVTVSNHGSMDGSHTVLLFVRSRNNTKGSPLKQLIGFERVHTFAGEATEVMITVDPCKHMSIANSQGERILLLGAHMLMLGDLEHEMVIED